MANFGRVKHDYIVYIDNVRVDAAVISCSTSHSVDSSIPNANIEFALKINKSESLLKFSNDFSAKRKVINRIKETIKEKSNIFIFVKNVISGQYHCIFNGNVLDIYISSDRNAGVIRFSVVAAGGFRQLMEIESLLSIPLRDIILEGSGSVGFKLSARTLDIKAAPILQSNSDVSFNNMTVRDVVERTREIVTKTNMAYRNPSGVVNFNAALDKIKILSDVDGLLTSQGILDLGFAADSLIVESLYVTLARQMGKLMLEFFEMPHGEIVIKAPYWNTPILKDHIVMDSMIISESSQHRGSDRVTRMLVQGGLAFYDNQQQSDSFAAAFSTPMAVYKEDSDGNATSADISTTMISSTGVDDGLWKGSNGQVLFPGRATGSNEFDGMTLAEDNMVERYLSFRLPPGQTIAHQGWTGIVRSVRKNNGVGAVSNFVGDVNDVVMVQYVEGPYKDFYAIYGGINSVDPDISVGSYLYNDDVIGEVGDATGINFFFKVALPDFFVI